jgi:hypothetical protein
LGWSVYTIKEDAEALVVASKETGLKVNADKTKYLVMSQDQNSGWNHSLKADNSSFARVEEFKYLETTLTIKILSRKRLRAHWRQGMVVIIVCKNFCLTVCYPKI